MLQRRIVLVLLLIICFSCASDETETSNACNLIDCATISLGLEFVAADTGEDLFFNETFPIDNLKIINTQTNQTVDFGVGTLGSGDRTIITLSIFLESNDLENYKIFITDVFEVAFSFSVEVISDPCCIGNIYTNVAIDGD
ncbi:MAG: hypothetical protein ACI9Y7_001278, partial [Dokdonia sp.]